MATKPPGPPLMPSPTGGNTPPASVPLSFLATAGLGLIGFIVGKTAATLWAPIFPKYVLLLPGDALLGELLEWLQRQHP